MPDEIYITTDEAAARLIWDKPSLKDVVQMLFARDPHDKATRSEIPTEISEGITRAGRQFFKAHADGKLQLLGQRRRENSPIESIEPIPLHYFANSVQLYLGSKIALSQDGAPPVTTDMWLHVRMLRSQFLDAFRKVAQPYQGRRKYDAAVLVRAIHDVMEETGELPAYREIVKIGTTILRFRRDDVRAGIKHLPPDLKRPRGVRRRKFGASAKKN